MAGDAASDDILSLDEFEDALGALLTAAAENDVDPGGSWVCRNGDGDLVDRELMIYELD